MSKSVAFYGRALTVELVLIAAAASVALIPAPPAWVEAAYSTAIYPHIERFLTPLSNGVPFALLDVLLLLVIGGALVVLVRASLRGWRDRTFAPPGRAVVGLAAAAAALYLMFLFLWGLNYQRLSMTARLQLDRAAPAPQQVLDLGLMAVERMNSLYSVAHQTAPQPEWQDPVLRSAFDDVQRALAEAPQVVPGRLKHSVFGPYFRWTGVDGMVNPFGLEVIANPDLLPFERPFVAAHEWGHLAGFANEADANFVGWLTCVRGTPRHQYSGWFYLYWQVSSEVNAAERARLNASLGEGPRRDVNAVIARLRRGEIPALQEASWRVYDTYLKANRVESGVRSYGEVVNLLLRARFAPGWVPVRRGATPVSSPR